MPFRWNSSAELRFEQIESGLDITFTRVFVPYYQELISRREPKSILEVGCGTGHLAAALASLCPHVEALEPSPGMHRVAQRVLQNTSIQLHRSTVEEFRTREKFDIVLSHMCAQTVPDFGAFCRGCSEALAPTGDFVFSSPHPCFWNDYKQFFPPVHFRYAKIQSTTVSFNITKDPHRKITEVPYHHRPLGSYIGALKDSGMVVTDFIEVNPDREIQALYGEEWRDPRYCVFFATKLPKKTNRH